MLIKAPAWNAIHRELLARLQAVVESFASAPAFDAQAYAAALEEALPGFAALPQRNPYYLARSFGDEEKSACARRHYDWLTAALPPAALRALFARALPLWSAEIDGARYAVTLRLEEWVAREGEMTLDLYAGATDLYFLSFTVVPASLFGLEARDALLVSRIQGAPDRFEGIRQATKALSDVAPRALLFAALTGLARAAGIRHIVGVSGENFLTFLPEKAEALHRQYDDFFLSLDAQGPQGGFYIVDTQAPPKPVTQVKAGHRIRTRKKRALKEEVASAATAAWEKMASATV